MRAKVPTGARAVWAECLTHALKHVAFYNDEKAWAQFFALPKMVLGAPPPREGGMARRRAAPPAKSCRLYTSPSPRDRIRSRMPASA